MKNNLKNLNHIDAGVFFDNIPPNQVLVHSKDNMPELLIYPDPASESIGLNLDCPVEVIIFDMQGRKVMSDELERSMNLVNLLPGMYILKTEDYKFTIFIEQ